MAARHGGLQFSSLYLTRFAGSFGFMAALTLLPSYIEALGATCVSIGPFITALELARPAGIVPSGWAGDRYSKRTPRRSACGERARLPRLRRRDDDRRGSARSGSTGYRADRNRAVEPRARRTPRRPDADCRRRHRSRDRGVPVERAARSRGRVPGTGQHGPVRGRRQARASPAASAFARSSGNREAFSPPWPVGG
jgi:hypothetical protein